MEWISENWVWIALVAGVVWLYFRGHLGAGTMHRSAGDAPRGAQTPPGGDPHAGPTSGPGAAGNASHRRHGCC